MNSGAMVRNDALVAISMAYTDSLKAATVKLKAAIDVAKASGKTDAEIKVIIATAFDTWKADMKAAKKVANMARKDAKNAFEAIRKGCKKEHRENHRSDDDRKSSSHSESDDDNGRSKNHGKSVR